MINEIILKSDKGSMDVSVVAMNIKQIYVDVQ